MDFSSSSNQKGAESTNNVTLRAIESRQVHEQSAPPNVTLRVIESRQVIEVIGREAVVNTYPLSTSLYGLGSEPGSLKTPAGMFLISEKFGQDAPLRAIFGSRKLTGEIAPLGGDEDLILTRILWLDGVEEGNKSTKERYIYIHGTNREDLVGQKASHGCLRMRNVDVRDLFELTLEGTPVEILP